LYHIGKLYDLFRLKKEEVKINKITRGTSSSFLTIANFSN